MALFPFFQDIEDKSFLVVGGGQVAARKVQRLLPFTEFITVVAPSIDDIIRNSLPASRIRQRPFQRSDLDGADIVIAATDDHTLNRTIAEECHVRNVPIDTADAPSLCTFVFPSLIQRGDLTIGITTGGKSPAYDRMLREQIEQLLPDHIDDILTRIGSLRPRISSEVTDPEKRRAVYHEILLDLLRTDNNISDADLFRLIPQRNNSLPSASVSCPRSSTQPDRTADNAASHTGRVTLVGAGCGPDLITMAGLHALQKADAVIYDDLIDDSLLAAAPEEAEKIYVGKRFGAHSRSQEEINAILIAKAQKGRNIVRLKGGDSFVFGRGGEEYLALQRAGIPCRLIPGVSSAIAVPEHAGIPVTHRGISRSFAVVTGHTKDGTSENFQALARLQGTLVFLMSLHSLKEITDSLIANGRDPSTPAAVISKGFTSEEKRINGTLSTIAADASDAETPAILVVGRTAALHMTSSTGCDLDGARIAVTGTPSFTRRVCSLLEEEGANASAIPTLRMEPLEDNIPQDFSGYGWIVFTSPNGAEIFFRALQKRHQDIRTLAGISFACIGRQTAESLGNHGIYADLIPSQFTSEALGEELVSRLTGQPRQHQSRVLLLRAENGSPKLTAELTAAGIAFDDRPIYHTMPDRAPHRLPDSDYLVFGSAGGVRTFFSLGYETMFAEKAPRPVCIGQQTAAEFAKHSDRPCIIASESTAEGIVRSIAADYKSI